VNSLNDKIALCVLAVPALLLAYFMLEMWSKGKTIRLHEIKLEQVTRSDYTHTAVSYGVVLVFVMIAIVVIAL